MFTWPLALRPLQLPSHPHGESDNHLWMLWRAWRQLTGAGPLANVPEGLPIPLMDPINLPLAAPGLLVDPALGYNLALIGNLALAFVGAWLLARALGAGRGGALVAGVGCMCSPFLSGVVSFGITESWAVGWLGLHAAALLQWSRTRRRWQLAASALALAAFALSGWYHAAFGLVAEVGLALWAWRRGGPLWGVLLQGAVAAALVTPRLLGFLAVREFWGDRWRGVSAAPPAFREGWRETPVAGTDLLNLLLPALESVPISKSVYLGGVLLGLALAAGRRAWPLLATAGALWALSLGHWISIAGHTELLGRAWPGPAGLLTRWIPALEGLSHWHRAAGPATVLLAAAAGLGADRLLRRLPTSRVTPAACALAAAVLVDALAASQTPWPRTTYDPRPPPAVAAAFDAIASEGGEGGVAQLPFDNGRGPMDVGVVPRIYNRWQPWLDRPVTENYEGPDAALTASRLLSAADALCGVPYAGPKAWRPPERLRDPAALESEAARRRAVEQLAGWGLRWVVLHRERGPTTDAAAALLTRALGEPTHDRGGVAVFAIPNL